MTVGGTAMRFVHGWCGTRPHNPHRASTGAPAPAPARTRAPELPHSSAGCARGARRHRAARAHVTVPITVQTPRTRTPSTGSPRPVGNAPLLHPCRLCMRLWFSEQTRVRAHGRRDLSVLPRAAPARPQRRWRPQGAETPAARAHVPVRQRPHVACSHQALEVLEPHTSDL